jgi:hypothetical protein
MFDISSLGVGEWFPYQDSSVDAETGVVTWFPHDTEADEKICLKQPSPEFMRAWMKKYMGKSVNHPVLNTRSKAMEIVVLHEDLTPKEEKQKQMEFWDEAIVDWTFKDPRTKEIIPVTVENKYKLVTMVPAFVRFCNHYLEILSGANIKRAAALEKNS